MNKLSLIFLVCAVLAVTTSQPVPEETEKIEEITPEIIEERALPRPSIGEIADRFTSAVRLTVKDERTAIAQVIREITDATRQSVKAGVSAAKAGIQIMLMIPNIGRTVLIDTEKINAELARP